MKVKTNVQAGIPGNFLPATQQFASSALSAVTENPALQSAMNTLADMASKLWYWPFAVPR